jgi:hypothetical protein
MLIENVHRKDLKDLEKAEGIADCIVAMYNSLGIEPEKAIVLVKSMYNNEAKLRSATPKSNTKIVCRQSS